MESTRIDSPTEAAHRRRGWAVLWLASTLPWALAIALLATNPVYPEASGWAQYSGRQILLAGLALALFLVHLALAGIAHRGAGLFEQAFRSIFVVRRVQRIWIMAALIADVIILLLFLTQSIKEPPEPLRALLSIFVRLLPVAWALLFESLILIGALLFRTRENSANLDWASLPGCVWRDC